MATFTAISEKTQSATAMKRVMDYVVQDKKTMCYDEQTKQSYKLISGQNCVAETAYEEFMATKHQYNKAKGVFFKQYVQSFKLDCGKTPQEIHAMGVKMAKAFEGYEVLIATHIDKDHWHNHLIVNSVSCETGLKIQIGEKELETLRNKSDEICKSFGIEILKPYQKPKQRAMNQREYRAALRGDSWKMKLMTAIDKAVQLSHSREQFIANMEKMGYGVKWIDRYKYITYTAPNGQRCRDNRLFDDKYLKSNMEGLFNEPERAQGTQQGNDRYSDRTVSATVDWSKVGTVERSGKAHNHGRNGVGQEHGFDLQVTDTARVGRSDGRYRDAPSVCDEGNHTRSGSEDEQYRGISNPNSQQFADQFDDKLELGYDEADENAGFDTVETQSKVGVDWGDVALGAIALGAAIETMVSSNDNGRKKKNHAPKTESRDKKKRHNRDHGYDLSL